MELRYNKGYVFSKGMFNQLTFQVKVLQGVQQTRGLNLIKMSCFCPQKSNNLDRKSNQLVHLQTLWDFRLLNKHFQFQFLALKWSFGLKSSRIGGEVGKGGCGICLFYLQTLGKVIFKYFVGPLDTKACPLECIQGGNC